MSTNESSETSQAEILINQGRYLEARALCEHALRDHITPRLQQLYALALSKSGAPEEARKFLEPVYQANTSDTEAAGILGGIYKQLFKKNQDTKFAVLSRDTYSKNFQATKNYYTGINAAAMSAIVMQASQSKELAKEVISLIAEDTSDFWELATLGEALLLLKEKDKSVQAYTKAKKVAGSDWGKITSVHNQLWLLNNFIPVSTEIQKMFSPPGIMSFAGHMIDAPGSGRVRFPAEIEPDIQRAIAGIIQSNNVKVGYCSLACGADILFAETLAEQNGEVHIYIPFDIDEFVNVSVRFAGEQWVERFNLLIKRFPVNMLTRESYMGHDELFAIQSKVVFGASLIRAAEYHTTPTLLTVMSEVDLKRLDGGTRDSISFWPLRQARININPDTYVKPGMGAAQAGATRPLQQQPVAGRPTWFMLFVDLTGLNQLESDKHIATIKARAESDPISYPSISVVDKTVVLASVAETSMIDVITLLKPVISAGRIKVAMHVGPVQSDSGSLTGNTMEVLHAMKEHAPQGAISASDQVATLLALHPTVFSVGYSGFFSYKDFQQAVFKIEWK